MSNKVVTNDRSKVYHLVENKTGVGIRTFCGQRTDRFGTRTERQTKACARCMANRNARVDKGWAPYEISSAKDCQKFDPDGDPDRFTWSDDKNFDRGWPLPMFRYFSRLRTKKERYLYRDSNEMSIKVRADPVLQQAFQNQTGEVTWWNVPTVTEVLE